MDYLIGYTQSRDRPQNEMEAGQPMPGPPDREPDGPAHAYAAGSDLTACEQRIVPNVGATHRPWPDGLHHGELRCPACLAAAGGGS